MLNVYCSTFRHWCTTLKKMKRAQAHMRICIFFTVSLSYNYYTNSVWCLKEVNFSGQTQHLVESFGQYINLLTHYGLVTWNGDKWWQRSCFTLAQVMACCLAAPSHYLNQCWLFINGVLWHSPKTNFSGRSQDISLSDESEEYTCKITATSPRGQWVKLINRPGFIS